MGPGTFLLLGLFLTLIVGHQSNSVKDNICAGKPLGCMLCDEARADLFYICMPGENGEFTGRVALARTFPTGTRCIQVGCSIEMEVNTNKNDTNDDTTPMNQVSESSTPSYSSDSASDSVGTGQSISPTFSASQPPKEEEQTTDVDNRSQTSSDGFTKPLENKPNQTILLPTTMDYYDDSPRADQSLPTEPFTPQISNETVLHETQTNTEQTLPSATPFESFLPDNRSPTADPYPPSPSGQPTDSNTTVLAKNSPPPELSMLLTISDTDQNPYTIEGSYVPTQYTTPSVELSTPNAPTSTRQTKEEQLKGSLSPWPLPPQTPSASKEHGSGDIQRNLAALDPWSQAVEAASRSDDCSQYYPGCQLCSESDPQIFLICEPRRSHPTERRCPGELHCRATGSCQVECGYSSLTEEYNPSPVTRLSTHLTPSAYQSPSVYDSPDYRFDDYENFMNYAYGNKYDYNNYGNEVASVASAYGNEVASAYGNEVAPVASAQIQAPSPPIHHLSGPFYQASPVSSLPGQPQERRYNDGCQLPECFLAESGIPGGLPRHRTPMLVYFSFDDAVTTSTYRYFNKLFSRYRTNPNGCPITATHFNSHENTDYSLVRALYEDGHEFASHSITHRTPQSWWKDASIEELREEISGQRDNLHRLGGVPLAEVRGMRSPFLQLGGERQFSMLEEAAFTYDSSMTAEVDPPTWPFSLQRATESIDPQLCKTKPCPKKSYALWEVPLNILQGNNAHTPKCPMVDACRPASKEESLQFLRDNFKLYYNAPNKPPFGLNMHAAWFQYDYNLAAMDEFMEELVANEDVWIVPIYKVIQWIQNPTPVDQLRNFQPFTC